MADDDLLTERLLRVIDEGRRTATYKLGLLLALIDTVALNPGATEVSTRAVAAQVLELYYPQTRAYVAYDGVSHDLRQISQKESAPVRAVFTLRLRAEAQGCRSLSEARATIPSDYATALDRVEDTFVRYPIPLLQVVGSSAIPFLYEVSWPEGTSARTLRSQDRDRIRFLDGVPERLVVLGPLLRPLIELHWTRDVARWTRLHFEEDSLRGHLFGVERISFPTKLRAGLRELQGGRCFYCATPLTPLAQVDHFLAWSRWPNDAIENLVLADRCNGDKSRHLAAPEHLAHWAQRSLQDRTALDDIAAESRWPSDALRSTALMQTTYGTVAPGTPLWVRGRHFIEADGPIGIFS